ncbi:MAG: microcyclamide/patellamide family RiPP [Moorea sp. SIO1G6]|uniref:DUF5837 family cyanobactin class RiPP n=1 Tax=Moorena sp. SIO1G6 TaxID=2607840 RepID=UPI0013BF99C8|nr:DUF5837 family cyanobactin class RiPP [Moorena sp. SIO1G6]NET65393.1 microcyclamide/patellamide family RiPP [Moorena sp. SIO1G6]
MDKKNITPEQNQPINRITSGQLPAELAELSEEVLQDESFAPALAPFDFISEARKKCLCSFDGDEAESQT